MCFLYTVDLSFLVREAVEKLYSPGAGYRTWIEMERTITTLNSKADNWLSHLPSQLCFAPLDQDDPLARWRTGLGFHFYTTKLIITQPCLRRIAYQTPSVAVPSAVCNSMASLCVQVARQMLALLPDQVDTTWLYSMTQWWCILHYIMQSTSVLLIELFAHCRPRTREAAQLIDEIQKAMHWLREMSTKDQSAQRAWLICRDLLSRHGP
ncbi:C6 transcription factor [Penicillium capsulatum]|uniref:C6 transcription factor n=1 Tax=Penicillium capsulatum TaxID=69766 RepID=A0A9W9IIX4_9EURO|nr:C6 transcription factor [Penicillium capsulatum]KAJ6122335.1 C6 transcription factor [Penicillium capsulatum]